MRYLKRSFRILFILLIVLNVILAFHAWKFTHFYDDVNHRNKRPEQMSTWEKARLVLFGVDLSKPVLSSFPEVAYETVYLKTRNGLRLEGWWIPAARPAKGSIVLLHGYGSTKGAKLPEAMYFREQGYNTFLLDFRAHGNSEGHSCSIGFKEAEEVKLAYDHVRSRGTQPVILWGMSMGAAAILKAVPEYNLQPDRLILEAPFATLTDAVKSRMWAVHLPGTPLAQIITFWGGLEQGFWAPGYKPAVYAQKVSMPVLLCWGREDIRVMAYETNTIFRQLGSQQKKLVVFEHSGHQSFYRSETAKWTAAVNAFLK
jgi:alpha-beta hydrolase superfamily lysophospholipase